MICGGYRVRHVFMALAFLFLSGAMPVSAAIVYHHYVVRQDAGVDILCAPHTIAPGEHLYRVFREKGELSRKDFPAFQARFHRLNPHLKNPDQITVGTRILIPLKELTDEDRTRMNDRAGVVAIPVITRNPEVSPIPRTHKVRFGDTLSRIIADRFGAVGSRPYETALKEVRLLNPNLTDLNRIYTGQLLRMPPKGALKAPPLPRFSKDSRKRLRDVVTLLEAKLTERGQYHFPDPKTPSENQTDRILRLSEFPLIQSASGNRILLETRTNPIPAPLRAAIATVWPDVGILQIPDTTSPERLIRSLIQPLTAPEDPFATIDLSTSEARIRFHPFCSWKSGNQTIALRLLQDPSHRFSPAMTEWLATRSIRVHEMHTGPVTAMDPPPPAGRITPHIQTAKTEPRAFLRQVTEVLGFSYAENLPITFPYAGLQVEAHSNMISGKKNEELLIDFSDLYGDAILAIEKTHFRIIQVEHQEAPLAIAQKLSASLSIPCSPLPVFRYPHAKAEQSLLLALPGFSFSAEEQEVILTKTPLPAPFHNMGLPDTGKEIHLLILPPEHMERPEKEKST